ncbi:hypothetical protein O6H91_01G109500 [Diphasiastrum complanatum]|uniref:Uncharacterized protein n=1 Tax=Diphasiastrum complanatum TaxID=34168 RepID=A0ACC2EUR2_DIPCM|nr:hypothetical protein O6H91_Y516800 [Diphasiastrum complanatum]KAJ7570188.1 hypothetical protein O6H91_01G109500 [Diphasiastrum complanatum]
MAPHGPLLRCIGNVLHIPPHSCHFSHNLNGACNQDSRLKVFEDTLEIRLHSLTYIEESHVLSLEWLKDALEVLVATNVDAQAFIPAVHLPLSKRDEKWIRDYLEDSSSVLYTCNMIREYIAGIDNILMLVKLTLHLLNLQPGSYKSELRHANDSLYECVRALKNWTENIYDSVKGKSKGHHLIEDMPKPILITKSEPVPRKNVFLTVLSAAKLTTIVICNTVVTAFTSQRDSLVEVSVPESFAWSLPLLTLQRTVKSVIIKRMDKGLNFFIPELCNVEFCLTKLKALLDSYVNIDVVTLEEELTEKTSNLVTDLKHQSEGLEKFLKLLEGKIDRLFHLTIENRKSFLDKLKG